jgi:hypothetical protein
MSHMVLFLKTHSEETLRCSYKDYSILNRWQANWGLVFAFTYAIYYSIMMDLRKGKKVSFLPPGDVNPGPTPSRRGLLEDSPCHAVGVACLSCD